jgi:nuclear transport factor 2 (NTF2) superfamily protein
MKDSAVQAAITRAGAEAAVRAAEAAFGSGDVARMLEGFTDDCIVRFAEQPEMVGKPALEAFLRARMARQGGYRLSKTLRAVDGDIVGVEWAGSWTDTGTGVAMAGKGLEFWTIRDGRIAIWDAGFNVWEKDGPRLSPVT